MPQFKQTPWAFKDRNFGIRNITNLCTFWHTHSRPQNGVGVLKMTNITYGKISMFQGLKTHKRGKKTET